MTNQPTKLRAPEAARYLRMGDSTLAKLRCSGGGPSFVKMGPRIVLYDRADLDAWLAEKKYASTSEYGNASPRAKKN